MSKPLRETVADWLMTAGALVLFLSLFLTWSHQFSPAFLGRYGKSAILQGVPHDPNAWQVYSAADVLLALVAGALMALALFGGRARRLAVAMALVVALAFTIHALGTPPTNGAVVYDATAIPPGYVVTGATAGAGETVALVALVLGGAGVAMSYSVDLL